ncbi:MAG: hypothetical protein IPI69_09900 [Bacteroidales bacterium]|nr:hypothetical protein [Bacteroidales bacterium]
MFTGGKRTRRKNGERHAARGNLNDEATARPQDEKHRAQSTGHRAKTTARPQDRPTKSTGHGESHASHAGHASLAGRANCTRPAR